MTPEILLVRNGNEYRVLHGYLHLASAISKSTELFAEASGEGQVKVTKTPYGIFIGNDNRRLPLQLKNK